jgi:hypothetical protein
LHELLARRANLLSEGSREHHDLLVVRGGLEDLLNVTAHVCCRIERWKVEVKLREELLRVVFEWG